ncbi:hypothetical protein H6G77_34835 [Aulosira sp. FACHB-615]|nr:hypothetical protein [Aulosira sp. FACHB-615]
MPKNAKCDRVFMPQKRDRTDESFTRSILAERNQNMSGCPIGLICEYFEDGCGEYCESLAHPWPLPFWDWSFDPKWRELNGFKVEIPAYQEYASNNEWEIISTDRYNYWVGRIRHELWLAGWWNAIELPYKYHPDGGIEVIHHLPLNDDVTFATPWVYHPKGYSYAAPSHREEFMPPIPINSWPHKWAGDIEADGFYKDWLIYWPSDFEGRRDYDYE